MRCLTGSQWSWRRALVLLLFFQVTHCLLTSIEHCTVFILGIYRGNISPSKVYSPQKKLRIRQKSATCAAKSFQLLGALSPDPLNRGSAHGLRWGNSPQTSSSGVNPFVSTISGHPSFWSCGVVSKYYIQMWNKLKLLGVLLPSYPQNFAPGPHWGTAEVRSPISPSCIKWQWVPLLPSTAVF